MTRTLPRPRCVGIALGLAVSLACFPASAPAAMVGSMPSRQRDLAPREAREHEAARLLMAGRLDRFGTSDLAEFARDPEHIGAGKGVPFVYAVVALVLLGVLFYQPY